MSKLGLIRGVGRAADMGAESIADKLKQERLAGIQKDLSEQSFQQQKTLQDDAQAFQKELLQDKATMGLAGSENERRFQRNLKILQEEGAITDNGTLRPESDLTARAKMAAADAGLVGRAVSSADISIANDPNLTGRVAESRGEIAGAEAGASESARLEAQLEKLPAVRSAVRRAEEEAALAVSRGEEGRLKSITMNMYETAMKNLSDSLAGTDTGYFVGRLPATTSAQQIAEGSIAVIAPILKTMFRAAGEGVFTDKDQELLMDMVPKRTDTPEAANAKIEMLDAVVRAKLGSGVSDTPSQQQVPPTDQISGLPRPETQAQYDALPSGATYIDPDDGKQYRKP